MNQFSVGKVLGTGFGIWLKNLVPFLLLTALIYSPLVVWGLSIVHRGEVPASDILAFAQEFDRFALYSAGLGFLFNIMASAALTYGIVMELQGQHASLGACIATGMARFFPVLGAAFMTMLCIIGGTIALFVPGIIVACMLNVVTQVAVLERPGVMASLARSRELTRGHRAEIFVILLLIGILNFAVNKLIQGAMLDPASFTADNFQSKLQHTMYVMLARDIVLGSLGSAFAAVTYYFLRAEKEGTSANELARVFE